MHHASHPLLQAGRRGQVRPTRTTTTNTTVHPLHLPKPCRRMHPMHRRAKVWGEVWGNVWGMPCSGSSMQMTGCR